MKWRMTGAGPEINDSIRPTNPHTDLAVNVMGPFYTETPLTLEGLMSYASLVEREMHV